MMTTRSSKRGLIWALIGGLILVIGIVALIIASLGNSPTPPPTAQPTASETHDPTPSSSAANEVVDETAADRGWVPEPITTDAETYVRAALAAGGTFDTTKAGYEDWIAYLGTWFTPDTRYASDADRQAELEAAKLEMRQTVVLPQSEWDSLAGEKGRVASVATSDVMFTPVPQDTSGDMSIGTADVTLTFTRADGSGGEVLYDETARLSVQVLCGPGSVPTPDTAQVAGDCKIVRFFSEPVEP
jgi:hypothetical protein